MKVSWRHCVVGICFPLYTEDLSKDANKLTSEDIAEYLRYLKLNDYIKEFRDIGVNGNMMFDIDYDTLKELGVDTVKDRINIKTNFKQWLRKKVPEQN